MNAFRSAGMALGAILLSAGTSYGQMPIACHKLSVALPEASSPDVDVYGGALGAVLLLRLDIHSPIGGDGLVAWKGKEWVWMVIIRGDHGCPLPPVTRVAYEAARRPLLGASG